MDWKENKFVIGMFGCMFLFLVLFFVYINPVVVYDGDDWCNLSYLRAPLPKWGIWNPIKVFPELLTPFAGHIAAYIINPFLNDYIFSITVTTSIILAVFITAYFSMFYRIATEKLATDKYSACASVLMIMGLHFLIFRSSSYGSQFMFSSCNLTCYYHYVIPNLLNAIMVMYLYLHDDFKNHSFNSFKLGWMLLGIYLAIFSNVFSSIILAVYISFVLLRNLLNQLKDKFKLRTYINNNKFYLLVLAVWAISLLFEAHGGRSKSIGAPLLALPIVPTLKALKHLLLSTNKYFIACCAISILAMGYISKRKTMWSQIIQSNLFRVAVWGFCMTGIYTILLCAKAGVGYIHRTDVIFAAVFYGFLLLHFMFVFCLNTYPQIKVAVPILVFVILLPLFDHKSFRHSTMGNVAPEKCIAIDNYLIEQIKAASLRGDKEMTLIVPKGDNNDNWPHPNYMGGNILKTLKAHGIVDRDMKIKIQPNPELNTSYNL